ncbi:MAG: hypothetical protein GY820_06035 [Gammaproteobacteria bacterium]|nr:hypothetical protein [Gammaproteobacteria bacterium]
MIGQRLNGGWFSKKQQGVLVRESEDAPATTKKCAVGKNGSEMTNSTTGSSSC